MFPKKTQERFIEEMNSKYGSKYELIGKYVNMNVCTTFKDNETGDVFDKAPVDLMRM